MRYKVFALVIPSEWDFIIMSFTKHRMQIVIRVLGKIIILFSYSNFLLGLLLVHVINTLKCEFGRHISIT
jgi:hypothetical protein